MSEGDKNYLKKVILTSDVFMTCTQHAFTTEKEEVIGLLIGMVDEDHRISHISAAVILHRSDKQPDRVEISPEHICTATTYAEELAKKVKKPLRVLGWYHSHPHITVWPSHVDVRTQATYQMMDPLFVGLIFSVYHTDSASGSTANHVQVTCFQAVRTDSEYDRREIELIIKSSKLQRHNIDNTIKLPKILFEEEANSHEEEMNDIQNELTTIHNESIKTVELTHIVTKITEHMCNDLEQRLRATRHRLAKLQSIRKLMLENI